MSDEGIELKSPFPVVPPVKDSKWGELPKSADGESRPVEPPTLYPDIGEPHPCPFFKGPELNFINPIERKVKKSPVKVPVPVPLPVPAPSLPVPDIPRNSKDEESVLYSCLNECLHGIVWECVSQQGKDLSKEMYCALISNNPRKFILDDETIGILGRKLFKKNTDPNWSEPCEPIDSIKLDVLTCQAYKLNKAKFTLTNEALSEFHKKTVTSSVSQKLMDLYAIDMEKKLRKLDSKELKQNPPRTAS